MVPYEEYLYHFIVPKTGNFVMFTNRRVVFLESPILGPIEDYESEDHTRKADMFDQDTNVIWEVIIETRNYHMIGMYFTIKYCIRVP